MDNNLKERTIVSRETNMAEHNEIGKIGEKIAKSFLMKHDFSFIEANYKTKFGEIDLIARKDNILRFIEVKSVKVNDFNNTLHITPEDNLTSEKQRKIRLSAEIYLNHKSISQETPRQFDLACVYINTKTREGKVKYIVNT